MPGLKDLVSLTRTACLLGSEGGMIRQLAGAERRVACRAGQHGLGGRTRLACFRGTSFMALAGGADSTLCPRRLRRSAFKCADKQTIPLCTAPILRALPDFWLATCTATTSSLPWTGLLALLVCYVAAAREEERIMSCGRFAARYACHASQAGMFLPPFKKKTSSDQPKDLKI